MVLRLAIASLLLGWAALGFAQFTTVTGTVTDPNGLAYSGGTIAPILVSTGSPTLNGLAYTPPVQPAGLNSAGSFTMQLAANTVLLPGGSQWKFSVCSALATVQPAVGKGSVCFTAGPITITGASQSITATLTTAALALSNNAAAPPLYLNTGTPTAFGNECAAITTDSSGNSITTAAALRTIDSTNTAHDVMCVVTSTTGAAGNNGAVFLPFVTSVGVGPSMAGAGLLEIANTGTPRLILTNTSTTTRRNSINWRSGVGGFGTDIQMVEDVASIGNEDMSWLMPSTAAVLYATFNCPAGCATTFANVAGAKQFLLDDGTHDAKVNPEFGLVSGHIAHGAAGTNATDTWGTATCSTNTVTVTFTAAFTTTTYKVLLTDQTSAGGARVSTKNLGSFVITCTGASDAVDYLVLGQPF